MGKMTFSTCAYVDFVIVVVVESRPKEQQRENSSTFGERTVTHLEKEEYARKTFICDSGEIAWTRT